MSTATAVCRGFAGATSEGLAQAVSGAVDGKHAPAVKLFDEGEHRHGALGELIARAGSGVETITRCCAQRLRVIRLGRGRTRRRTRRGGRVRERGA